MSTILDDLSWRYATKKFDNTKKLSDEQLNLLKEGFNLTASSYGLQPVSLVVIENQDLKEKLVAHSMEQEQVANASHLLVFCVQTKIDSVYINDYFKRVQEIRNTPDQVLAPFKDFLLNDFKNKDASEIKLWATKQAYLAMGNLLTICAVEKIDACPMEGFIPEEYDKMLGLKERGLQSVLIMPVGYRAQDDPFTSFKKVRKPLAKAIVEM